MPERKKDIKHKHSKYEEGLSENTTAFYRELQSKFPDIRLTSGKREGDGTSHHHHGDAIDIGKENYQVYEYLMNTREGLSLMTKYGYGIIDETDPIMMKKTGATGPHYHIGPDSNFKGIPAERLTNFENIRPKTTFYKANIVDGGQPVEIYKDINAYLNNTPKTDSEKIAYNYQGYVGSMTSKVGTKEEARKLVDEVWEQKKKEEAELRKQERTEERRLLAEKQAESERQASIFQAIQSIKPTEQPKQEQTPQTPDYDFTPIEIPTVLPKLQSLFQVPEFEDGGELKSLNVASLYEKVTGKEWSNARREGLTDGSYESNIKLRESLLKEYNPTNTNFKSKSSNIDFSSAGTFNEAFKEARERLGKDKIFTYQGRRFGTNLKGESFNPTDETLKSAGMPLKETKSRLNKENRMVSSNYSDKQTVKLEEGFEYKDWKSIRKRQSELNKMSQSDIINNYYKNKGSDEEYLILDKNRGVLHLYKGGEEVSSYDVGVGKNIGDQQTVTKYVDRNKDGKITDADKPFKVDWSAGNFSTGAGIYEVSRSTEKTPKYGNLPSWNFVNSYGIEVPMAIHSSFGGRTSKINNKKDLDEIAKKHKLTINNYDVEALSEWAEQNNKTSFLNDLQRYKNSVRMSTGCINGVCKDLKDLYYDKQYGNGQKLYVLADDMDNYFEVVNDKILFRSEDPNVNRSVNTIKHKDIRIGIPTYYKSSPTQSTNVRKATNALSQSKSSLIKDLKINGDVYNDLSLLSLGIMGQETDYGNSVKYWAKNDFTQDVLKQMVGNTTHNSKGLSQIKYDTVIQNEEVKKLFNKYGITKESLKNGDKSAIASLIILATTYKYELPRYDDLNLDYRDKLLYLYQGRKSELDNNTATPAKSIYHNNVKKYADKFTLEQRV